MKLKKFDSNSMYVEELSYFLKNISNRKKTFNDVYEGAKILDIGMAILKSSKLKKMIKL